MPHAVWRNGDGHGDGHRDLTSQTGDGRYMVTVYTVMAYIVMAYMVTVYTVMAWGGMERG